MKKEYQHSGVYNELVDEMNQLYPYVKVKSIRVFCNVKIRSSVCSLTFKTEDGYMFGNSVHIGTPFNKWVSRDAYLKERKMVYASIAAMYLREYIHALPIFLFLEDSLWSRLAKCFPKKELPEYTITTCPF